MSRYRNLPPDEEMDQMIQDVLTPPDERVGALSIEMKRDGSEKAYSCHTATGVAVETVYVRTDIGHDVLGLWSSSVVRSHDIVSNSYDTVYRLLLNGQCMVRKTYRSDTPLRLGILWSVEHAEIGELKRV